MRPFYICDKVLTTTTESLNSARKGQVVCWLLDVDATKERDVPMATYYDETYPLFRSDPIVFIVCCVFSIFIIGIPVLLYLVLKAKCTRLTITERSTTLRTGILAKNTIEVQHRDIRSITIRQGLLQRLFGTGDVLICSAGTGGVEIAAQGFANPEGIKRVIDKCR